MIFKLEGRITPKARPRLGNGRAFLPKNYRDWKDLDNLAGACLDALVQAGILADDRLQLIPSLAVRHYASKKPPSAILTINPISDIFQTA